MPEILKQPENPLKQKFEALAEKSDFSPAEKRHYDELVREYLAMTKELTEKQMSEAGKPRELEVATAKLKEITNLVKRNPEVEIDISEFNLVNHLVDNNGRMFFLADEGSCSFLLDQDKNVITDKISGIKNIEESTAGKRFFEVIKFDGTMKVVDERGLQAGLKVVHNSLDEIESSRGLTLLNGEAVFITSRKSNRCVVTNEKGWKISDEYDHIRSIVEVGGKLVMIVTDGSEIIIVVDGEEVFKSKVGIGSSYKMGDKIFYTVQAEPGEWVVINQKGEEVSARYKSIENLTEINGKLVFVADVHVVVSTDDDIVMTRARKVVINESGEKMSEGFKTISDVTEVRGKFFYSVQKDNGKYVVLDEDGAEASDEYPYIENIRSVGDEFELRIHDVRKEANIVTGSRYQIIRENGEVLKESVLFHKSPQYFVNEQFLLIKIKENGNVSVVNRDGEELSDEFYLINDIYEEDGKVYVLGRKDKTIVKQQIYI